MPARPICSSREAASVLTETKHGPFFAVMNPLLVVMGVSGCGKSTVGAQLAAALGVEFLEGDQLHSAQNIERMASGVALTDDDRQDWLERVSGHLARARWARLGLVVSCSALKRAYRDILRRGAPDLILVHLSGQPALLAARTAMRPGHYMPASLLHSQFAILEPPGADENALTFDVANAPDTIVEAVLATFLDHQTLTEPVMPVFNKVVLYTDTDGRARFRDEPIVLSEGSPQSMLSVLYASGGYQLRHSPLGFRSQFHCTGSPQWVFILAGQMEIGLQGAVSRVFGPGQHFYSADRLPEGATFDPQVHGHWSRQVGPEPLITLFVRG